MSDIVQNTTIADDAKALLISQFKGKEKFEALVGALVSPLQTAEDDLFAIRYQQKLDYATGDMLDKWGEMVGITRQGRLDPEYLIQIKAKIAINVSTGTINEVADIFNLITGATHTEVFERFPREVAIFTDADLSTSEFLVSPPFGYSLSLAASGYGVGHYATTAGVDAAYLFGIMDRVLAAGYRIGDISYLPSVTPFAYSDSSYGAGYGVGAYATSL